MFVVISTGVLLPAPYVDEYGECDEGLKRGNPLKLDKGMYEELNKVNHTHCQINFSIIYQPNRYRIWYIMILLYLQVWLNNDIPDKISRHFDTEVVTISARWYEL